MKYSEFIREVEKIGVGLRVDSDKHSVHVMGGNIVLVEVPKIQSHLLSTDYYDFGKISSGTKTKLLNLAVELASTPLEDREDEKRYRLKLPFGRSDYQYLNQVRREKQLTINNKFESNAYKTIFTESEIAELKREHNLDSFVMEEVKEDE